MRLSCTTLSVPSSCKSSMDVQEVPEVPQRVPCPGDTPASLEFVRVVVLEVVASRASQRQRCPGAAGSRAEPTKGTSQNACAARARRGAVGRRSPCSGDARCTLCRHRVGHGATPQRTGAIVSSYAAERRGVPPSPCLPPGRRATLARGSPRPFPGPGAIPSAAACILSRARLLVLLRPLILPQMR